MVTVRPASERGRAKLAWLDSRHTFSFGDYYDPAHMGFRALRVINDDRVAPGGGFGTHPHRDMEIVTVVVEGAAAHRDSMGNETVIRPGEVQRMSAGSGVTHSEYNVSDKEPLRFLQIWVLPARRGEPPSYAQKAFPEAGARGALQLLVSPDGREGSVSIGQDARVYKSVLEGDEVVVHELAPGRGAWVQIAEGRMSVGGKILEEGDGAAVEGETALELRALGERGSALLFDLA
ncbi:MAG: pirin family protein [Candidatus Methylomirabilis sp.]|nr:pirin family protein [Deltaproteobacteria bacterium]